MNTCISFVLLFLVVGFAHFSRGQTNKCNILWREWTRNRNSGHAWAVPRLSGATAARERGMSSGQLSPTAASGEQPSLRALLQTPVCKRNKYIPQIRAAKITVQRYAERVYVPSARTSPSTPPKQNNNCNKQRSFQKGQI